MNAFQCMVMASVVAIAAVAARPALSADQAVIGLITKHLKKGARIRLNGLGILVVRKRGPRMGRNPATGEAIKIKASRKVAGAGKQVRLKNDAQPLARTERSHGT